MKLKLITLLCLIGIVPLTAETFLRIDIDSVDYSQWPKLELHSTLVDYVGENTTINPNKCAGWQSGDQYMDRSCPSLVIRENGKTIDDVEYYVVAEKSSNTTQMIISYGSQAELEDEKIAIFKIDIYGVHNGDGDTVNIDNYPRVGSAEPDWAALFTEADKELNLLYSKIGKNIPAKEMTRLRESQRNWLQFRDSDALIISGMKERILYERTRVRIEELEEVLNRLR